MDRFYYDTIDQMQKLNVDRHYMLGWIGGYMKNPKLEEQRVTDSYEAGYEDGKNNNTGNFIHWSTGE